MSQEHELYVIANRIRYDLTALQGRVTELLSALGRANLPDPVARTSFMNGPVTADHCSECGVGNGHTTDCTTIAKETAA